MFTGIDSHYSTPILTAFSSIFGTEDGISLHNLVRLQKLKHETKQPPQTKQTNKTQPISLHFIFKILKDTASSTLLVVLPNITIYMVKNPKSPLNSIDFQQ